ncbi:transmembrane protein, putative (macronuclear) [Tetrahymena thermophila SB210]|uniref:Transmembrane protein, putative n=1 Tax=Tetrahymena thermophila (strain SB210) TaxID=312017 RepID=X1W3T0_TETTS|nr:transmembrane protein, putative [Tetrahymena thermophila SB210]EDK31629.1 transmembrane protein, putative [Tetrahymena thermophila SB210]|eukprot:XP_001471389.1 transmembrane protein, putative [Tetrahymena thermophila SB210]
MCVQILNYYRQTQILLKINRVFTYFLPQIDNFSITLDFLMSFILKIINKQIFCSKIKQKNLQINNYCLLSSISINLIQKFSLLYILSCLIQYYKLILMNKLSKFLYTQYLLLMQINILIQKLLKLYYFLLIEYFKSICIDIFKLQLALWIFILLNPYLLFFIKRKILQNFFIIIAISCTVCIIIQRRQINILIRIKAFI